MAVNYRIRSIFPFNAMKSASKKYFNKNRCGLDCNNFVDFKVSGIMVS